jgi:hypothetical protein
MVGLYFSRHCINRAQFFVAESNSTCTGKLLPGCPNALEPLTNNRDSAADLQTGARLNSMNRAVSTSKPSLAESPLSRTLLIDVSVLLRTFKNLYRHRFEVFY